MSNGGTTTDTRARAIVAAGAVTETNRAGVYRAQGSKGQSYLCSTQGWCDCAAARYLEPGKVCKHVVAARMAVADALRAQAKARNITVLRGASDAEMTDTELDLYGPGDDISD